MSSEGMNIRDLNTVILATPKSRIEQAVGRIFRLKKEERTFHPIIFDVLDSHDILYPQYKKRVQFYEQCGYKISMKKPGEEYREIKKKAAARHEEPALPSGVPMFRS